MAVLLHILGFINLLSISIKWMYLITENIITDDLHCTFKEFLVYGFCTASFIGRDSFNIAGKIFGVLFDILSLPASICIALLCGIIWSLGRTVDAVGDVFERLFLK